jgi:uncharacterized protein (DUF433 family)
MDWRERITLDPNILAGKPIIKGTRLSMEFILGLLAHGSTPDEMLKEYDHLTLDDIHACFAYGADLVREEKAHSLPDKR